MMLKDTGGEPGHRNHRFKNTGGSIGGEGGSRDTVLWASMVVRQAAGKIQKLTEAFRARESRLAYSTVMTAVFINHNDDRNEPNPSPLYDERTPAMVLM